MSECNPGEYSVCFAGEAGTAGVLERCHWIGDGDGFSSMWVGTRSDADGFGWGEVGGWVKLRSGSFCAPGEWLDVYLDALGWSSLD